MSTPVRAILIGAAPLQTRAEREWLKLAVSALKISRSQDLLIGVDGGLNRWRDLKIVPDLAVGDWDSLKFSSKKERDFFGEIPHISLPQEKDRSDLFYALAAAVDRGATQIVCFGVMGERPDHTLATLLELQGLAASRFCPCDGILALSPEAECHFVSPKTSPWFRTFKKGQSVSIFSLSGTARGVTLRGFDFPLRDALLKPSSRGLSNRARGGMASVSVRSGAVVVMLARHSTIG